MLQLAIGQRQLQQALAIAMILLTILVSGAHPSAAKQVKPSAIFVFGDSYADTGNRNKSDPLTNQAWQPYGITWGAGRFSDGRVATDHLVELVGLPPLANYEAITNSTLRPDKLRQGVNFAVGGAGVFPAYGKFPTIFQQVGQLQEVLSKYPRTFRLESSVAQISYNGNDYAQLKYFTPNVTTADYLALAEKVVGALGQNLANLYKAGLRNFLIGTLAPSGCLPSNNGQHATRCDEGPAALVDYHNARLSAVITQLRTSLPDARILLLDLFKGFNYVIDNPHWFGIRHPLGSCCAPSPTMPAKFCGDNDADGKPLYSVCPDPEHFFFWDGVHPSDAGWKALVNLIYSGYNFTSPSPNLLLWLQSLHLGGSKHNPRVYEKAALDLVHFLALDYPHLLSKFRSSATHLPHLPSLLSDVGAITVFLPIEAIIQQLLDSKAWPGLATEVALRQAVYGWWPTHRLQELKNGSSLTTLGGNKVHLFKEDGRIFLTARQDGSGRVAILQPSLFAAKGVVLVHKASALLLPEALVIPA